MSTLRVEQLYPFPARALITELDRFKQAEIVWCQEEPKNMGSWTFVEPYIEWVLEQDRRPSTPVRVMPAVPPRRRPRPA
jgi:2-oxoglutarate dehydrogenase E1 component